MVGGTSKQDGEPWSGVRTMMHEIDARDFRSCMRVSVHASICACTTRGSYHAGSRATGDARVRTRRLNGSVLGCDAAVVPRAPRRPAHAVWRDDATHTVRSGKRLAPQSWRARRGSSLARLASNTGTRKREPELEEPHVDFRTATRRIASAWEPHGANMSLSVRASAASSCRRGSRQRGTCRRWRERAATARSARTAATRGACPLPERDRCRGQVVW